MTLATLVLGAALNPGGLLAWLIVGLIAGFLASVVMRGGGYGIIGDIIVGVVGAFIGGLLTNLLAPDANFGFWGSIVIAFIGACILIAILRAVSHSSKRTL
ncbi:MAG TPA: GlsB/YeaQ/YmgE family stress response membrane protein [Ktedonobacteraceae bacterium]|nr:GlsB/YeaQ/YmgE family stress response membrane protein [Ktedonobacteraceae bacterium]